jgi:asparagine synthase (glutamine-hydrolysing)
MAFQPYHTHQRSNLEAQPEVDERGNMLTFDGRVDNHEDLCRHLSIHESGVPDSRIVLAAFERWGEESFSHLIGDWALALWSHAEQCLYLARDHAGARTLYYELAANSLLWSTHVDTFLVDGKVRQLDDGYAANYLSCRPVYDLTPYKGIKAVIPAHYIRFRENHSLQRAHWQWMVKDQIRYKTDSEYEEHFFALFRQSVERRTCAGSAILAELSGGMDSSSIVCMSDRIRNERGAVPEDLLDTVSYYEDSEPNWNEAPYFSVVEAQRRKTGRHVNVAGMYDQVAPVDNMDALQALPGVTCGSLHHERLLEAILDEKDYRIILSGSGGDEVLGGVPTPLPELAEYLTHFQLSKLLEQGLKWSRIDRSPLLFLVLSTTWFTATLYISAIRRSGDTPLWLSERLHASAARKWQMPHAIPTFGLSPNVLSNGLAWFPMLDSLPHLAPKLRRKFEYRYPYLDRDLITFIFGIPRISSFDQDTEGRSCDALSNKLFQQRC